MELKREGFATDNLDMNNYGHNRSKRVRKQSQEYAGQLKGEDAEIAFDKAINRLERQSIRMFGFKEEPMNTYPSYDKSHHLNTINLPTYDEINNMQPPAAAQDNLKQEYQLNNCQNENNPNLYCAYGSSKNFQDTSESFFSGSISKGRNELPLIETSNGGICGVCGKQFTRMDTCKRHFIQAHGESAQEKNIICLICKEAFAYKPNFSKHMKQVHNISDHLVIAKGFDGLLATSASGQSVCLVCCKVFTRIDTCKRHLKSHQNQSEISSGLAKQVSQKYNHVKKEESTLYLSANRIHEHEATEIKFDVPITTCQVNEDAVMQSMKQTNNFTSVIDSIFDNPPTNHQQEATYNINTESSNCNMVMAINPNDIDNGIFSTYNLSEQQFSSDPNVESQLDSAADYSSMLEFKKENHLPEYQSHIPLKSIKLKQNVKKEKLTKSNIPKKSPKESKNMVNAKQQISLNPEMKITKMESGQVLCEVCGKILSRIDKARDHYMKMHGEKSEQKNFFCQICDEGYVFDKNLKSHMKSVHQITSELIPYEGFGGNLAKLEDGTAFCFLCKKKYSRIDKAREHYNKAHQNEEKKIPNVIQELWNLKENH